MFGIKFPEYTYNYFDGNELKQKTLSFFQKHIIRRLGFAFRETYFKNVANKAYELSLEDQFQGDSKKLLDCIALASRVYGGISYTFPWQGTNFKIEYYFVEGTYKSISLQHIRLDGPGSIHEPSSLKGIPCVFKKTTGLPDSPSFQVLKRAIGYKAEDSTA